MNRITITTCLFMAYTGSMHFCHATDKGGPYQCVYSTTTITLDGKADEIAWQRSKTVSPFVLPVSGDAAKTGTTVKLTWDLDYFYFYAEMQDANVIATKRKHDASLWFEDVLELFLRPSANHTGYYEFQVSPLGTTLDIYWPDTENRSETFLQQLTANNFNFEVVTEADTDGWKVEGRILWRDMKMTGGRPAADEVWSFALCRYDYQNDKDAELSSSAHFSEENFHQLDEYGQIKFVKPPMLTGTFENTASRVIGTPIPPPPFKAVRKYEHFELNTPIFLALEPGTNELLAITQDNPEGKCRLVRIDRDTGKLTEMLRMKGLAYNLCFHPDYSNNGYIFLGLNDASGAGSNGYVHRYTVKDGIIGPETQKLIIKWPSNGHNGAAVTFGNDGMLYVTTGDGTSDSDVDIAGQRLDHFLAKLLRLDVDSADEETGYIVPKDNPFVGREGTAPETYAYGLRNPWRMTTDSRTGQIWIGNNGQDLWEQIYLVQRGANWGWSVYEGSQPFYLERQLGPDPHTKPTFEHAHSEARSLTGGIVYYGAKYPQLQGAYIYGDYSTGKIWAGKHNGKRVTWHQEIADTRMAIACFLEDADGDLLVLDYQNGGEINKLVLNDKEDYSRNFPRRLSDSGLFADVASYKLKEGAIPYGVNSPLWSDGTYKTRHVVLTDADDRIGVLDVGPWDFPEKTVIVKSFSLQMDEENPHSRKRIETRFMTKQDNEWVGYSYRWNKSQTDAFLVPDEGREEDFRVSTAEGMKLYKWKYPSRSECMMCHARAAKYVLGLQTVQLNRDFNYSGHIENQLSYLQRTGKLQLNTAVQHGKFAEQREMLSSFNKILASEALLEAKPDNDQRRSANDGLFAHGTEGAPKLASINDPTASIATRARSYIFSNCAQCHVGAGGGNSQMHFEWSRSLTEMKIINALPLHGLKGIADGKLVAPGEPDRSVLLKRMATRGAGQMPIIATHQIDKAAVDVLRQWILNMPASDK